MTAIAKEQLGNPIFNSDCSHLDFTYYKKGFEIVQNFNQEKCLDSQIAFKADRRKHLQDDNFEKFEATCHAEQRFYLQSMGKVLHTLFVDILKVPVQVLHDT